jgi:hypothetical protein
LLEILQKIIRHQRVQMQLRVAAADGVIAAVIVHDVELLVGGLQRLLQLHRVLRVHVVVDHAVNE